MGAAGGGTLGPATSGTLGGPAAVSAAGSCHAEPMSPSEPRASLGLAAGRGPAARLGCGRVYRSREGPCPGPLSWHLSDTQTALLHYIGSFHQIPKLLRHLSPHLSPLSPRLALAFVLVLGLGLPVSLSFGISFDSLLSTPVSSLQSSHPGLVPHLPACFRAGHLHHVCRDYLEALRLDFLVMPVCSFSFL